MTIKIGVVQLNPTVGAISANRDKIIRYIDEGRQRHCDLVVFPELALVGYSPLDLLWHREFIQAAEAALAEIVRSSTDISVILGTIEQRPGAGSTANIYDLSSIHHDTRLYNTAFLISDCMVIGKVCKIYLPSFDVFAEERYFTSREQIQVFDLHDKKIGINICEDLWHDGGPTGRQADLGADLVINLSASPFYRGKTVIRHRLGRRRAIENGIFLLYVNLCGAQDEIVYDGGSFAYDDNGRLIFQSPYFTEGLTEFLYNGRGTPITEPTVEPLEYVYQAIILGIRDYVQKNNFTDVIIGLSGGIDSALTAALAVAALGAEKVTAVFMPSDITSAESRIYTYETAQRLGIEILEISIAELMERYQLSLPPIVTGIVAENLQARIRGNILMALANSRGALVLAPANKSEIAVGYNTLYGDTVGALAPIADLYKTEVYQLALLVNHLASKPVIPHRVITRAPSAELRPNQLDEDDLPPYTILDPLLKAIIEQALTRQEIIARGFSPLVVDHVLSAYHRSEYKRRQLPPGIKVSARAFGIGRKMPITYSYRD
ncbi:NAD+ synthase [Candidatus Acetothermia bacterium]|jgi:NAD+ synthase (glutamine-hydrolysing)|nr:NAD+ synthase [Candidatus Acetothermia bacterium]MCI2427126.1 NAD+ synthase [Candidatus Acetothermia bacterium]MCI2428971.1 NAD+ synthase [Candidatus Acetothermia bacterium]